MADVTLTQITGVGETPRLAPDLSYPSSKNANAVTFKKNTGINAVGALTSALSLNGRHIINYLNFTNLTTEQVTIKLTIDGDEIWNDTFTLSSTELVLFGDTDSKTTPEVMGCNSTFLLEIETATDPSVDLEYLARPVK